MALCQTQFIGFHDAIKLKDENKVLREIREKIEKRITENLPEEAKSYEVFNQGSYAMNTGIQPLDGDYDIDMGLFFDMSTEDATPIEAKQWVYDAVKDHTDLQPWRFLVIDKPELKQKLLPIAFNQQ